MDNFLQLIDLQSLFTYQQDRPLLFTQFYFWGFFTIVLSFYALVYKRKALRNIYLLLCSLFFYYKTGGIFVVLLIFTIVSAFYITKIMHRCQNQMGKKWWLALGITVNLLILFYFKYAAFIVNSVNEVFHTSFHVVNYFSVATNNILNTDFVTDKIFLPVGISFFTFQAISYCVDVYRKQIEPVKSVLDFGFYVSFFPQLVAGPIVRASEFIPQIYKEFSLTKQEFGLALFMVLKGLIKKVFISDYISINFIDRVFDTPMKYSGYETLMSLYGYSLQVYTDFSGYTDIAIGLALMMGFRLSINFNSPYKAKSAAEFWRRWHISLSTWLRDYLYIPIGGNRNGSAGGYICWVVFLLVIAMLAGSWKLAVAMFAVMGILAIIAAFNPNFKLTLTTAMNNLITMLLGGLWHGSSWMFVIWGGYNGIGSVISKLWKKETQILRWIIFAVVNILVAIAYYTKFFTNENGLYLWAIANFVWFFCYCTWLIKTSQTKNYKTLKYILGIFLIAFFTLSATVITGYWFTPYKYFCWIGLSLFAILTFYTADKIDVNYKEDIRISALLWINFFVSMFICFCGVNDTIFVVYMLLSAIVLAGNQFFTVKRQLKDPKKFIPYFWGIFLTFNFITFTRIWFRAPNIETTNFILERLLNGWDITLIPTMTASYKKVFAVMAFGYFVHWLSASFKKQYTQWFVNTPMWAKVLISIIIIFVLYQVKSSDLQPFIYFQF